MNVQLTTDAPNTADSQRFTLAQTIANLPCGAQWAVKNWICTDEGARVAAAICQGTAIAVSDGSFKDEFGTASLVLEGNNRTDGSLP